jgi:hypothetical protein
VSTHPPIDKSRKEQERARKDWKEVESDGKR